MYWTFRSRQPILFLQVSTLMQAGTYFFGDEKNVAFGCPLIFTHFLPASTLFRGHLALATSVSSCERSSNFGALGATAHEVHLDKCNRARDFGLEFWYDVQ